MSSVFNSLVLFMQGALNEDDEDQQEEKQRSLAILQGIVGSQAMNSLKHKTTSNFKWVCLPLITSLLDSPKFVQAHPQDKSLEHR